MCVFIHASDCGIHAYFLLLFAVVGIHFADMLHHYIVLFNMYVYKYIYININIHAFPCNSIPVVPHNAVAEVSKIGNNRKHIGEVGCCESRMAERSH